MAAAMMRRLMATRGRSSPSSSDRWADFIFLAYGALRRHRYRGFFSSLQKGRHRLTVGTFLKNGMHEERLAAKEYLQKKRDLEEGLIGASDPLPPFFLGLSFVLHLTRAQRGYRSPRSSGMSPAKVEGADRLHGHCRKTCAVFVFYCRDSHAREGLRIGPSLAQRDHARQKPASEALEI